MAKDVEVIDIDILDIVKDEKYWHYHGKEVHLSGHMYRNSPYETDDSCGNCDGARCDYCKKIVDEPYFSFCISTDELYDILISKGVSDGAAQDIAYNDFCRNHTSDGFHLIWPRDYHLEERYPEEYKKITEPDKELWKKFDELVEEADKNDNFFSDEVKKYSGLSGDEWYNSHIYHQMEMYNEERVQVMEYTMNYIVRGFRNGTTASTEGQATGRMNRDMAKAIATTAASVGIRNVRSVIMTDINDSEKRRYYEL